MNEETEKKLINLLEKIESHLAKMATQNVNNEVAILPVGEYVEADIKIQSPGREWKNGKGWFYDAEMEYKGGKTVISFAVNKGVHFEAFEAGTVIFARVEKGKPSKRGESVFWLSKLIGLSGKPVQEQGDPFESKQPTNEKVVWKLGSEEPPPF